MDGWSNPFLWEVSDDGQTLTLISKGKNGVYEHEKENSDDIHFPIIKPLKHAYTKAEPVVSRQ
jgi:hypothetical protein